MDKKNQKPFVKALSESELRAEAERLLNSGRMPSIEDLCAAVLESRQKYSTKIRRARREAQLPLTEAVQ